jgi:hypothetical protein
VEWSGRVATAVTVTVTVHASRPSGTFTAPATTKTTLTRRLTCEEPAGIARSENQKKVFRVYHKQDPPRLRCGREPFSSDTHACLVPVDFFPNEPLKRHVHVISAALRDAFFASSKILGRKRERRLKRPDTTARRPAPRTFSPRR